MKFSKMSLALASLVLATPLPASAAQIAYIISGTFDLTIDATLYPSVGITSTGIGDTGSNSFIGGVFVAPLTSVSSQVTGYGTVNLPGSWSFFVDNNNGTAGASVVGIPLPVSTLSASEFLSYDGVSSLGPIGVTYLPGLPLFLPGPHAVSVSNATGVTFQAVLAPVPEPASWALMIGGFALAGGALRRRKAQVRLAFA